MMSLDRFVKPWTREKQRRYYLHNANVVHPLQGTVIFNQTIELADGKIVSVSETSAQHHGSISSEAIELDLEGRYVCPGLIDCHVHISTPPGETSISSSFGMPLDAVKYRQPYLCHEMLRRGFTTVRDCGGTTYSLKEAINEGVISGPRLFIAGRALSQSGGHADFRGMHDHTECCGGHITGLGRIVDGVPECLKYTREELRCGADFIKIMAGGGVASPTDRLENIQFTAEEIRAITTVAESYGTYVTAHAYTCKAIRHSVENGVRSIEHGNMIDAETAKFMAEKGAFLTPTLVTYAELSTEKIPGFLSSENASKNTQVLAAGLHALQIANDAGVTICYGSDLVGPYTAAQTREFTLRAPVLSPEAILQSATTNAARLLRQEHFLGQIKVGFAADLLVLKENPLKDILSLDRCEDNLLAVMKDGRIEVSRWSKLPTDVTKPRRMIE